MQQTTMSHISQGNSAQNQWFRQVMTGLFCVLVVLGQVRSAMAEISHTLIDADPPIIEHEVTRGGVAGGVELFSAVVVDNDALASVQLFYRFSGEDEYTRVTMRQVATSSSYVARILTSAADNANVSIEYYIRAEDMTGNLALKGFAFQPLKRELTVPMTPEIADLVDQSAEPETIVERQGVNWLYVAVGVLLVGGLAAAADRGGDDGLSEGSCIDTCTVDITAPVPAVSAR